MIKKKKIAGIAGVSVIALSLCIGSTSVFAANNDGLKKNADAKAITVKVENPKAVVKGPLTHEDLVATAAKFGINAAGMSDEQIQAALVAYKQSQQENAKTEGLPSHNELSAIAAKLGIKTDGMTDKQIEAALTYYKQSHHNEASTKEDIQATAKKLGINTTGMSLDQIKDAIKEKAK
jgi:uncharacterized protein (DUF433 family)